MAQLISHNGEILNQADFNLAVGNRAISFGDGFFESCLFKQSECKLWLYHLKRINTALNALCMENTEQELKLFDDVVKLLCNSGLENASARVKITFYRNGFGTYTPQVSTYSYFITATLFADTQFLAAPIHCDFAQKVYVNSNGFNFKSLSALNYVLASIEKQNRQLDDLLLHNENGQLTEATSSNLWWYNGKAIYTPHAKCGGVNGVFKAYLLDVLNDEGIDVLQGAFKPEDILAAHEVFLTNAVQGIRPVERVKNIYYKTQMTLYLIDKCSF
ncbi:MAG: aminotransferase class IV [Bacteroidia bacterium]